ncbi:MAG: hypothetical protein AAF922_11515 [Pseudomonadota bacterium]
MRLSPEVKRHLTPPGASTLVVVRLAHGAAYKTVKATLTQLGASVRSSGSGGIVTEVTLPQAQQLAVTKGVLSIDLPRRQSMKPTFRTR